MLLLILYILSKLPQHHYLGRGVACACRYLWSSTRGHHCCLMVGVGGSELHLWKLKLEGAPVPVQIDWLVHAQRVRPPTGFVSVQCSYRWRWRVVPIRCFFMPGAYSFATVCWRRPVCFSSQKIRQAGSKRAVPVSRSQLLVALPCYTFKICVWTCICVIWLLMCIWKSMHQQFNMVWCGTFGCQFSVSRLNPPWRAACRVAPFLFFLHSTFSSSRVAFYCSQEHTHHSPQVSHSAEQ